jgi:hypothetical protein
MSPTPKSLDSAIWTGAARRARRFRRGRRILDVRQGSDAAADRIRSRTVGGSRSPTAWPFTFAGHRFAFIRPSSAKPPAMSLPNIRSQATMEVPVDASMGRPQSSRLAWDRQRILAGLRECPAVITK